MRKLFYFLGLSLFLMSCNQNSGESGSGAEGSSNAKVDQLKGEVMKIHDDAMHKKGDVQSLLTTLKKAEFSSTEDSLAIQEAYKALKNADKGMMQWMREFKQVDDQGWSEDEKIAYLKEELEKMNSISNSTNEALALANETVETVAGNK